MQWNQNLQKFCFPNSEVLQSTATMYVHALVSFPLKLCMSSTWSVIFKPGPPWFLEITFVQTSVCVCVCVSVSVRPPGY